jgi:LysR family transcriptional regulator, hydrogen peroxide-inducible genes activator
MELHQIRYFVALARAMNFTRAAEQCNVTQPALTKAIQKLEYELGGPLVFRERQLTQLTDLGKLMFPMLARTLAEIESARTNAREFKRRKVATLRVALTPSISASILMKPLAEVTRILPGIQVDLVEAEPSGIFERLLNGEVGAVLGSSCVGPAPERIDRRKLFEEQMFVACSEDGRLAEDRAVKMKDLRVAKWLEPTDCEIARAFREAYLSDEPAIQPRHRGQGLQHLVGADLGIMLVPEHAPVAPGTAVRPIADLKFVRTVELFVVAGRQYSPALEAFVKVCRSFDWRAQFASKRLPSEAPGKTRPFEATAFHALKENALRLDS